MNVKKREIGIVLVGSRSDEVGMAQFELEVCPAMRECHFKLFKYSNMRIFKEIHPNRTLLRYSNSYAEWTSFLLLHCSRFKKRFIIIYGVPEYFCVEDNEMNGHAKVSQLFR